MMFKGQLVLADTAIRHAVKDLKNIKFDGSAINIPDDTLIDLCQEVMTTSNNRVFIRRANDAMHFYKAVMDSIDYNNAHDYVHTYPVYLNGLVSTFL